MNTLETSTFPQKREGKTTAIIESKTSRLPSGTYLTLAVGSMIASAAAMLSGKKQLANFIGQWVPSLLIIGLYNKVVKLEDELLSRSHTHGEGRYEQSS